MKCTVQEYLAETRSKQYLQTRACYSLFRVRWVKFSAQDEAMCGNYCEVSSIYKSISCTFLSLTMSKDWLEVLHSTLLTLLCKYTVGSRSGLQEEKHLKHTKE